MQAGLVSRGPFFRTLMEWSMPQQLSLSHKTHFMKRTFVWDNQHTMEETVFL